LLLTRKWSKEIYVLDYGGKKGDSPIGIDMVGIDKKRKRGGDNHLSSR